MILKGAASGCRSKWVQNSPFYPEICLFQADCHLFQGTQMAGGPLEQGVEGGFKGRRGRRRWSVTRHG